MSHIELATSPSVGINVTPTLTTHGAYVANDYVGTDGIAMVFANVARVAGGGGFLNVNLIDYALQSVAGELWLFDTDPTPPADNAAWTITDANSLYLVGVIPFSIYYASAANSNSKPADGLIPFKCAAGSTSLYGCFVTRGTPTYANGDLTFRMISFPTD